MLLLLLRSFSCIGDIVVIEVELPFAVSFIEELLVSLAEAVVFFFGNGSGGSKISSSISANSSSLGFSSGSREPVVILTRGLECSLNLIGAMSKFAWTIVLPLRGTSTDIVGCFDE